mmetsp:Transcript_29905/g.78814  ORF Transcript_29905/g.78814 Transcript_29905/m.78814 type:complete len:425 (-) Transcript_29905:12-1286(-)
MPPPAAALTTALASPKVSNIKQILLGTSIAFLAWLAKKLADNLSRSVIGLKRELYPVEEWVLQYDEDAVDTDISVFDCHHHAGNARWPRGWPVVHDNWLTLALFCSLKPSVQNHLANQDPKRRETFGPKDSHILPYTGEEILADMRGPNGRGHNVVGSIFVTWGWKSKDVDQECMLPVKEADAAAELHRQNPQIINGFIGKANLSLGAEVEPALQYYKKNPLVVGVRHSLSWAEAEHLVKEAEKENLAYDSKWREGFALLAKYGLCFDTVIYHLQIDAVADLARDFPDTTIIVNHMAVPLGVGGYNREEVRPTWEESMKRLAKFKNVYVKIGGFGMHWTGFGFDERPTPPSSDELATAWGPYVLFVIAAFGVDRCMMESNFPMDKITCSYTVLFNALKKITRSYSKEDRRNMFELNAKRVYKIK